MIAPRALWWKALSDARLLCLALVALMFSFHWIFVWLTSQIELGAFSLFLNALPRSWERLGAIPFNQIATPTGRLSLAYVHPVPVFAAIAWSIARGSDVVSGEIGRGTMEMLLAQPIRRSSVLVTHAVVTAAGSLLICLAGWLGLAAGVATVRLPSIVHASLFLPGTANLFAFIFFLTAATTLASSWDSYRWRTIGFIGGFYIIELILKLIARMAPRLDWLSYTTFLTAYEPQLMIVEPEQAWATSWAYDGTLIGLGLVLYLVAGVIFCKRDLPAPS
jgi:ABC-2 type transport system permease protein